MFQFGQLASSEGKKCAVGVRERDESRRTLRPCNRRAIPPCARRASLGRGWCVKNAPGRCARDSASSGAPRRLSVTNELFSRCVRASQFSHDRIRGRERRDRSRRCGFVVGRALRRALSGVGRSSSFARGARRAHFPAARSTPHAHIMPSLTVKPCAQRHEWNLYLNASMFTSTTALDPVFISEVNATAKVGETIDFVRARAGRADRAPPRRVDGFEEKWTKVLYRGQELDQSMSWDEVGLFAARGDDEDEDVVVTVVWKEIAAEGYKVATDAMDDVSTDEDEGEF